MEQERAPLEWTERDPHLAIPEWHSIGAGSMPPSEASRHVLVFGETGAGKTRSGVLPFAQAWLRYPGGPDEPVEPDHPLRPSMLVVDPKQEVAGALAETSSAERLGQEILRLDSDGTWSIWLFEGVEPLEASGEAVTSTILSLSAAHAEQKAKTREAFFSLQAERFLQLLIEGDLELYRRGGAEWVSAFWVELKRRLRQKERVTLSDEHFLLRHLDLLALAMRTSLSGPFEIFAELAEAFGVSPRVRAHIETLGYMPTDTYGSVVATAQGMTKDVADPEFLRHVGIDPFAPPSENRYISLRRALSRGACLVYSPLGRSAAEAAVGRALKSRFFRAAFTRPDQQRPVVYICDEAHRYVTSDPASGEQAVLDRGRAYRISCLLATQSLASLRHALAGDPVGGRGDAALDILLSNTGSKLFFRSTDTSTRDRLRRILPESPEPGRPHVIDVRPPSTLRTGEAYVLLGRGEWGRARISMHERVQSPPDVRF